MPSRFRPAKPIHKPVTLGQETPPLPVTEDPKKAWESRFKKQPVTYQAQDGNPRDVRTFIFNRSYILEYIVSKYKLKGPTDDDSMLRCCLFVQNNIRYVSDTDSRKQEEFWQNPEDTIARGTGDCEDGAILMKSLSLIAGVPDWKCKIVAGMVEGGGHAYCTYIFGDRQLIMDWCYWATKAKLIDRKALGEDSRYKEVWFSFNYNNSYSGKSVVYSKGKVSVKSLATKNLPDYRFSLVTN